MSELAKRDADAVRYIVLRKLASGLRHTLMGELQSIQFLGELGTRLLVNGTDDARMRDTVGKIPAAAAEAISTCHSVIEWLRPEEGAVTTLGEAVGQCVKLAGDDWRMRATQAKVDLPDTVGETRIPKAAARELIVTSLLALADERRGSLDIDVLAQPVDGGVELTLRTSASTRASPFPASVVYHTLEREDVALLAAAHGIPCECVGEAIRLRFAALPPRG